MHFDIVNLFFPITFWPRSSIHSVRTPPTFENEYHSFLERSFNLWTRFTRIYITIIHNTHSDADQTHKERKKLFDRLIFHVVKVSINIITLEGYRSRYINNTFIKD